MIHIDYLEYSPEYIDASILLGRDQTFFAFAIIDVVAHGMDIFVWLDTSNTLQSEMVDSTYREKTTQHLIRCWEEQVRSTRPYRIENQLVIDDYASIMQANVRKRDGTAAPLAAAIRAQEQRKEILERSKFYPIEDIILTHVPW